MYLKLLLNLKGPFPLNENKPLQAEKRFKSSQTPDGLADCRERGRVCLLLEAGSSEAKLDSNHLEHHPEGAGVRVDGEAEQIKRILKSSWQLNKTVCCGTVFKRWPPYLVPGSVHVLVSHSFHFPPCLFLIGP